MLSEVDRVTVARTAGIIALADGLLSRGGGTAPQLALDPGNCSIGFTTTANDGSPPLPLAAHETEDFAAIAFFQHAAEGAANVLAPSVPRSAVSRAVQTDWDATVKPRKERGIQTDDAPRKDRGCSTDDTWITSQIVLPRGTQPREGNKRASHEEINAVAVTSVIGFETPQWSSSSSALPVLHSEINESGLDCAPVISLPLLIEGLEAASQQVQTSVGESVAMTLTAIEKKIIAVIDGKLSKLEARLASVGQGLQALLFDRTQLQLQAAQRDCYAAEYSIIVDELRCRSLLRLEEVSVLNYNVLSPLLSECRQYAASLERHYDVAREELLEQLAVVKSLYEQLERQENSDSATHSVPSNLEATLGLAATGRLEGVMAIPPPATHFSVSVPTGPAAPELDSSLHTGPLSPRSGTEDRLITLDRVTARRLYEECRSLLAEDVMKI